MREAVIVSGVRTAIGSMGGALKNVLVEHLASTVMKEVLKRTPIDPSQIDEIIMGHGKQSSDTPNLARVAALYADLPIEIPAYTVHRQCGSGLQSIISATQSIMLGDSSIVMAGGAESMSTSSYYIRNARYGYGAGNSELLDPNTESQPKSQPAEKYGRITMGLTAENIAEKYHISRSEQDAFAFQSQCRATDAIAQGKFRDEIISLTVKNGKETKEFGTDEFPRKSSVEKLSTLKAVFKKDGTVTAGNASGRNDGAAALILMERCKAERMGIPAFKIVSYASAGVSPEFMGIGPVPATIKALKIAGLTIDDIGLIEINEAFAAQTIAVIRELRIDQRRLNVNGGAIALGHPIGATGSRIMITLMNEMRKQDVRYGMCSLCIAGGLGTTIIIEKI